MAWGSSTRRLRLPSNWKSIRLTVLRRDSYRCKIQGTGCRVIATEVDHIARGDNHSLGNLQAVCPSCHRQKTLSEAQEASARKRSRRLRPTEKHPGSM